jgi:hypothetical protein
VDAAYPFTSGDQTAAGESRLHFQLRYGF